ncbi:hypothetical protein H5410_045624 [Solanum commersonii]|uniref:Uncharacterized protein n=1 Tax=Solanum commersonii TaxID=4109 RepID=A0A9J5XD94_SOLCO|nr:hypothetical protein H5410_045624 [Solanum commersonii]
MSLFQDIDPLDSRNINDSKKAKDALQGGFLHGTPLSIEFAKLN